MVFDRTNETVNPTALVEGPAQDGCPLVAAIDEYYRAGKVEGSRAATIHDKNNAGEVMDCMQDWYLRYINKQEVEA
jgi:MinD superfamily P-loop ATPase